MVMQNKIVLSVDQRYKSMIFHVDRVTAPLLDKCTNVTFCRMIDGVYPSDAIYKSIDRSDTSKNSNIYMKNMLYKGENVLLVISIIVASLSLLCAFCMLGHIVGVHAIRYIKDRLILLLVRWMPPVNPSNN